MIAVRPDSGFNRSQSLTKEPLEWIDSFISSTPALSENLDVLNYWFTLLLPTLHPFVLG